MSKYSLAAFYVAVLLCIITPYTLPSFPILPLLPKCMAIYKGVHAQRRMDGIISAVVAAAYFMLLCYPLSYICFFIPYHWCLLLSYSLFFVVLNRDMLGIDEETLSNKLWFRVWLALCWNPPLLLSFHIVSACGGQLSAPLVSIIDDDICVGCLPCTARNVSQLYGAPYHVRAIINLCDETMGPVREYEKYGMYYLQVSTLDTTPPSIETADAGIKFIQQFVRRKQQAEQHAHTRVFIHCKFGIGRSVTLCLCWLLSKGMNLNDAFQRIRQNRKQVTQSIFAYKTVQYFVKNVNG